MVTVRPWMCFFHSVSQEFGATGGSAFSDDWHGVKTGPKDWAQSKAAGGVTLAQSEDTCVGAGNAARGPSSRAYVKSHRAPGRDGPRADYPLRAG